MEATVGGTAQPAASAAQRCKRNDRELNGELPVARVEPNRYFLANYSEVLSKKEPGLGFVGDFVKFSSAVHTASQPLRSPLSFP